MSGLFGALPSEVKTVCYGGTDRLWARWNRWIDMSSRHFSNADINQARSWQFITAPGVFDETAVAGVLRMSRTRTGRYTPLTILTTGTSPKVTDPWFDQAKWLLDKTLAEMAPLNRVIDGLRRLPPHETGHSQEVPALFWIDDWEVHELPFHSIHELAENGFARMLATETTTVEA